ncbi:hypothetical protein GCM10022220_14860 [Actinocatenispora rupis]|uniref:Uncharacterized protein n=1 Tax=Actinocatenispora rupis TaxID=519421 RepID=A0A8J3J2V7_9ACTN|nr:hypothetical protein [Actinocatenispora rupis]GID10576.1 hypothetical protein Aru02nite_14650 [Actinocatenispora rupis]
MDPAAPRHADRAGKGDADAELAGDGKRVQRRGRTGPQRGERVTAPGRRRRQVHDPADRVLRGDRAERGRIGAVERFDRDAGQEIGYVGGAVPGQHALAVEVEQGAGGVASDEAEPAGHEYHGAVLALVGNWTPGFH